MTGISIDTVERLADEYMCSCKLLQNKSIHSTIFSSIRATLNDKSQETAEHAQRLAVLTRRIGEKLNLTVLAAYPNSLAVFTMRSTIDTPNGHLVSQAAQAMQSDAFAERLE